MVALPKCSQSDLVEFAKGVRFAKQRVHPVRYFYYFIVIYTNFTSIKISERVAELALGLETDPRVEAVEGEDQLSALRRACSFSVEKLIESLEAINTVRVFILFLFLIFSYFDVLLN